MSGIDVCPKCKGRRVIDIGTDYIDCMKCRGTGIVDIPAPSTDDTAQIDDQVQDLVTVMMINASEYGVILDPERDLDKAFVRGMYQRFRKDLASLGIRLTYDTTIGGE